jgi:hypothetical protein
METPRARHKLDEVGFFIDHLRKEREGDAGAFGYFLSAFLNAAYSFIKVLEVEAKRGMMKGAASKKQAKAAFRPWLVDWIGNLSSDERPVWVLMEAQRRDEVHRLGAETVKETKAIPLEPPKSNPALFYVTMNFGQPELYGDAWMEEKRRLGLPSWATAWREAQVHHFEIAGERRDVVETCQRYLALLERLLTDFHGSPLAATPGG